jgi:hypothetical protein
MLLSFVGHLIGVEIDFNRLYTCHQSYPWTVSTFATEVRLGALSFEVIPASCSFRPSTSSTPKSARSPSNLNTCMTRAYTPRATAGSPCSTLDNVRRVMLARCATVSEEYFRLRRASLRCIPTSLSRREMRGTRSGVVLLITRYIIHKIVTFCVFYFLLLKPSNCVD